MRGIMTRTTADGFTVTTIEQNGAEQGEEIGRVFLIRRYGHDYYGVGSVEVARKITRLAHTVVAANFEELVDQIAEGKEGA